ncbi:BLUF domain-containing protein [Zobellia uliginosa]|uniref:BLUF domain-containing protein n=1 Tax=Zobellia uliginosa TaxID=143224 RepID=UPI0026E21FF7|nr:BLUF domain-containing protein [Zobellia uliginosa]MDO6519600.1 BLUF domain-containing protein [Zobellia uliginosa]
MYTLTYESKAVKGLSNVDIEAILETARNFNKANGLTGCLIFYKRKFIQILEGEKEKVQTLFENIKQDPRHSGVYLLSEGETEERNFPNWGMVYYPIDDNELNKNEYEQFKRNLLLLADLTVHSNKTAILFWKRMKVLITMPPDNM